MFRKTFNISLLLLCCIRFCIAQSGSTPDLILSPSLLPADGLTRPQDFYVEWTAPNPKNDVNIELVLLGSDNKLHRFPAKSTDGRTFQIRNVSLPTVPRINLVSLSVRDSR